MTGLCHGCERLQSGEGGMAFAYVIFKDRIIKAQISWALSSCSFYIKEPSFFNFLNASHNEVLENLICFESRWIGALSPVGQHSLPSSLQAHYCPILYYSKCGSRGLQHWLHLGAWEKCRIPGPAPDLLYQNLHFHTVSGGIVCMLSEGPESIFISVARKRLGHQPHHPLGTCYVPGSPLLPSGRIFFFF